MKKRWWKSRTLWLNFILAMSTVFEAHFGLLQAALGQHAYLFGMTMIAGVNFLLRFATTQPLEVEKP